MGEKGGGRPKNGLHPMPWVRMKFWITGNVEPYPLASDNIWKYKTNGCIPLIMI